MRVSKPTILDDAILDGRCSYIKIYNPSFLFRCYNILLCLLTLKFSYVRKCCTFTVLVKQLTIDTIDGTVIFKNKKYKINKNDIGTVTYKSGTINSTI